jgi:hypothetical protein
MWPVSGLREVRFPETQVQDVSGPTESLYRAGCGVSWAAAKEDERDQGRVHREALLLQARGGYGGFVCLPGLSPLTMAFFICHLMKF